MKKQIKKLPLKIETIQTLNDAALTRIVGGGSATGCNTVETCGSRNGCDTYYASCPFCGPTTAC